jgi:hypothetical protein
MRDGQIISLIIDTSTGYLIGIASFFLSKEILHIH